MISFDWRDESMELKELSNEEFYQFIQNYPVKSIFQTPEYGFVMNAQNYDSLFLGLVDNKKVVAASLILIEKLKAFKYAYAPRGLLVDYEDSDLLKIFTTELKKYLGKREVIALKISPLITRRIYEEKKEFKEIENYNMIFQNLKNLDYYHMGYNFYFEAMKPRYEAILEIDKPYYELFQSFKKSVRTKIRGSVANGIQIFKGSKEDLKYLYLHTKRKYPRDLKYYEDCYEFFHKKNQIDFFYAKMDTEIFLKRIQKEYYEKEQEANQLNDMITSSAGNNSQKVINHKIKVDNEYEYAKRNLILATKLLREYPDGLVLASALIVKNNEEVYMIMDGYDKAYKGLNAKHLLIWKMIEKYSKEGYKKFNFGGVTNPEVKENTYQGLNDFKRSFHSKIYEYAGDFEIITNSALYFLYRNVPLKGLFKRQ